jgi:hypothetical protein
MSQVKATQKLQVEDAPKEQRGWVAKLVQVVNAFVSESISILNGGILFSDNILGQEHIYDFKYQSDTVSLPVAFKWTQSIVPRALSVVSATADSDPVNVCVAWRYTEDSKVELTSIIQLTSAPAVALLTAGVRYKIRVRVTP